MTLTLTTHSDEKQTPAGRILVIDDDVASRQLLRIILQQDYQVTTVGDGQTALKCIQTQPFDLVLLDITMPGMTGFEVLKALRQDSTTADLPVILMSVTDDPTTVVKGLEAGANDYVVKPVTPSVLMARVKTQVNLKRLTDERKQYIEQLKQAEQMRTRFTHIASHDLKNPLHNLRLAAALLKEELQNNPRVASVLKMLDITIDTMQHVIETFLDIAAIQANSIALKLEATAVSDVITNVISQYEIAANEKDSQLVMKSVAGYVRADKARTVQVVSNLVSNALKYSPYGSTITIWTETLDENIRLSVQDEGPGIPRAERTKLFTEFAKLSPRPTGNETSTGLGLWIVKHLMEKQGGSVGVSFPADGGSIFWVELPAVAETELLVEESA